MLSGAYQVSRIGLFKEVTSFVQFEPLHCGVLHLRFRADLRVHLVEERPLPIANGRTAVCRRIAAQVLPSG